MTTPVFDFWVGVLAVDAALDADIRAGSTDVDTGPPSLLNIGRRLQPGGRFIVEVIRERTGESTDAGSTHLLLLLSTTDGYRVVGRPWHGCFGFTNQASLGDKLSERGFPLLEARIELETTNDGKPTRLRVFDPLATGAADAAAGAALLTLHGVQLDAPVGVATTGYALTTDYTQPLLAPDIGDSGAQVLVRASSLGLSRTGIQRLKLAGDAGLHIQPSERLNLAPLAGPQRRLITLAWRGTLPKGLDMQPTPAPAAAAGKPPPPRHTPAMLSRHPRPAALAATGFRFEDVELYGFRIDLREHGKDPDKTLEQMVGALNFHTKVIDPQTGLPSDQARLDTAYRYRAASRTVVVELLRYGKMLAGQTSGSGASEPFTAQHELLLRVLVGRVDDNTVQARDPAVFVPAIFVDNPLSKLIGRELQGFKKRLASFADGQDQPLSIDGFCGANRVQQPLADVTQVGVSNWPGDKAGLASPFLQIGWPESAAQPDGNEQFEVLPGVHHETRWRQDDFDDADFRRAFASEVLADGWNCFRSLQAGPVDNRPMPKAWIGGSCTLRDVRVSFPVGIVTLTLGNQDELPTAWKALSEATGGEVALPTGAWYHLRCSLDLRLEDSLR